MEYAHRGMHTAMRERLEVELGATKDQVASYDALWELAYEKSGEPQPCPDCHMKGKISRVIPLNSSDGTGHSICEVCRTKFSFPGG